MYKSFLFVLFSFLFGLSAIKAYEGPQPIATPATKESQSNIKNPSQEIDKRDRKLLYDLARKGVVIVNVKSYANISANAGGQDSSWSGSGFIVDKEKGIIATNRHVAGEMSVSTYEVKFSDGSVTDARLIYFDPYHDFAFLRVDPPKIPTSSTNLSFAAHPVRVNDTIFSIGNSAGDEFSLLKGVVFSTYNSVGPFSEQSFRYSGISVGGSSGSPVFNESGQVVGIVYAGKFVSGVALPITYIHRALESLTKGQLPTRRSTGAIVQYTSIEDAVEVGTIDQKSATEYMNKFPEAQKQVLAVTNRIVGSPASKILLPGDIIWKINGDWIGPDLYKVDHLTDMTGDKPMTFEIFRDGQLLKGDVGTYAINLQPFFHLVSFAGCIWYENTESTRLLFGEANPGLFINASSTTSPFKVIFEKGGWFSSNRLVRITHIDNKTVNNIKDLTDIIPKLMTKKKFDIRYIDYLGNTVFGDMVSADRQERYAILKYEPQFDSPKEYIFDRSTSEWKTSSIKSSESPNPLVKK